jgi:type IV pilus assembly protein PilQ
MDSCEKSAQPGKLYSMKKCKNWKNWLVVFIIFILFSILSFAGETKQFNSANLLSDKPITLDFKMISVRELLRLSAGLLGVNMVISENVTGSLSLHLQNIKKEHLLDIILEMSGLVKKQRDNVLYITTANDLLQTQQTELELQPLRSAWIKLYHADVTEAAALLKGQSDLLSKYAQISVNNHDNSIWIKEKVARFAFILSYLQHLDTPEKQVLIEAKIVNVDDSKLNELGLHLKKYAKPQDGRHEFNLSLPEDEAGRFTLAIAKIGQVSLLDLELSALERMGHGKVIASPRLITQNHKTATIEAGEEIPYQEKTSSGATSVTFKKAALGLKVTPQLTPDNRILLELEINQNKMSPVAVNGTPAIQTQELRTQVVVDDGQTVVLGGIFEKSDSTIDEKLPLLGSIPVLGQIFNRHHITTSRKQLLIFVTPRVMANDKRLLE